MNRGDIDGLRAALSDPEALCAALGIEPSRTERHKWRCPRHGGTSLSVTRGRDGGLRVKCFGCDFTGDAFGLIAECRGLDASREFHAVLREAGAIANRPVRTRDEDARWGRDRSYPSVHEVTELLAACADVVDDAEASAMMVRRGLEPWRVDDLGLARVLAVRASVPSWAMFHGRPWTETGHRLLLPVVDALGDVRSVRAWRVTDGDTPKRLPPAGHRAAGLVLACPFARGMLAAGDASCSVPLKVVICEGEPDFLTWATAFSDANEAAPVVLGVVVGSWTASLAARIPPHARLVIRTHNDAAGDRYANEIARTLPDCNFVRSRPRTEVAA